jgi:hypothetical protein
MIWTFRMMKNISPILALRSASSYFVHFWVATRLIRVCGSNELDKEYDSKFMELN